MLVVCAVAAHAFTTQTDTVGGESQMGNGGTDSYKMNVFGMGPQRVRLELIEVYLRPAQDGDQLHFVVYQDDGLAWNLVYDSGAVPITAGAEFKASPPVDLDLDADATYAIGVYLDDDAFDYVFADLGDENIGWALVNGVLWTTNGTVQTLPDPIVGGQGGTHHYDQRVTVSIPDDLDADGFDELADCNDSDAAAHPGGEEVCNGADDDCDDETDEGVGTPMFADADLDGYGDALVTKNLCEPTAGWVKDATDCDDANASAHPGADEICDGVDSDCDGEPGPTEGDHDGDGKADCEDCAPNDPNDGCAPGDLTEDVVARGGCGCDGSVGASAAALAFVTAFLGVGARRRPIR